LVAPRPEHAIQHAGRNDHGDDGKQRTENSATTAPARRALDNLAFNHRAFTDTGSLGAPGQIALDDRVVANLDKPRAKIGITINLAI
jgi:hypothetical protein